MKIALTIAGSDSGGGAGIQADLKTFAALGVYGTSAITAVTAQNTMAVSSVYPLPADIVTAQIEAVASDFAIDAVKTGMLADAAIVEAVGAAIEALELPLVVVDPVMIAKSGGALLDPDAVGAMRAELLPRAFVATPNVPEAEALADVRIRSVEDAVRAGERIRALGVGAVIVKGGHLAGPRAVDVLLDREGVLELTAERVETRHTHGTGCTFAAALAANLAHGRPLRAAAGAAKEYVTGAIRRALAIGRGHGPLDHFWNR
jgi:hydroxymethylpyrimidine/phosphomethylpyrimidine kinase